MRFMIMVKANQDTEAGKMPEEKLLAAMAKYHEDLAKAGVLTRCHRPASQFPGLAGQILRRQADLG
jgi:hypothetical protein